MHRNLPIFMEDVPRYDIRGDTMHIIWPTLEIVLPVTTMLAGMAGAREAIAKWHYGALETDNVVRMVPRRG